MAKLSWDSRAYEDGIDRGVLYLEDGSGVAWSGLSSVSESTESFESTANYIDGYKYALHQIPGGFAATLEAFTYPDEFEMYDGYTDTIYTSQKRNKFNFSYRTRISGAEDYKIHLVYGALTQPTERANSTLGGEVNPTTFSWALVADAHYILDSFESGGDSMSAIEDILYGSEDYESQLPDINDIIDLFESHALLRIIDNGDGTWTASGPDDMVSFIDDTTFKIDSPTVIFLTNDTYTVSSY